MIGKCVLGCCGMTLPFIVATTVVDMVAVVVAGVVMVEAGAVVVVTRISKRGCNKNRSDIVAVFKKVFWVI